jgi:hypothetical protein
MGALNWLARKRDVSRMNETIPVLRRADAQAEAGPRMLMILRRADIRLQ